jgi:hypothetical protein
VGTFVELPSGALYLDLILVRNYTYPEPEISFGEKEEKIMSPNLFIEEAEYWFSPDWEKRAKIIINNLENRNSLSDYPLLISVSRQNEMNSDFSDLRFTANDGKTLLSYWFESYGPDKVNVWVKIPHISSLGREVFYVYWGNSSATYRGNPKETFAFYDDFDDFTQNNYTIIGNIDALTWDTANSRLLLKRDDRQWFLWPKDLILTDFAIEIKGGFGETDGIKAVWRLQDENNYYSFGGVGRNYSWSIYENGKETSFWKGGSVNNITQIKVRGYQTKYLFDYLDGAEQTYHYEGNSNLLEKPGNIGFWASTAHEFPYVDSLLIRPFTQPQPTYQWGSDPQN